MSMRGMGGPLLCIGDLLNDVGEEEEEGLSLRRESSPSSSSSHLNNDQPPPDLTKLFQEHYADLNSALSGTDHSWTSLTLKLCTALETANHLLHSTNSNVASLSQNVQDLQIIIKRADSAIAAAKALYYVTPHNHSSASE